MRSRSWDNARFFGLELEQRFPRPLDERVRIESYTMTGGRCVYDLQYIASPDAFDTWRTDFRRFVDSFGGE